MALPRQLQEQLDQANATLETINSPPPAPAPEPTPEPEAQVAPEPTPEPTPAAPEPQATPEPQAQSQQQPDVWEHKYKTLQGLFNREVPTLQNQVKDLKAQLEMAVARLDKAADAKTAAATETPVADPRDVENFGQDLVDMVNRVARASLGDIGKQLEQRLQQIESALQGTTQQVAVTAEQAFFDRLTKLVPEWETVNANQAFLGWLAEVDPILGQPRQAALDAAQQTLNADRAAAVFKAFTATLPQAPAPRTSAPLDKQVSPKGSAASAPPQQPAAPKVWPQKDVIAFYEAKRRGDFRGRDAEAQRLEAEINLAMAEGRIQ